MPVRLNITTEVISDPILDNYPDLFTSHNRAKNAAAVSNKHGLCLMSLINKCNGKNSQELPKKILATPMTANHQTTSHISLISPHISITASACTCLDPNWCLSRPLSHQSRLNRPADKQLTLTSVSSSVSHPCDCCAEFVTNLLINITF